MKPKINSTGLRVFNVLVFLLALFMLVYSSAMFSIGFHNVDSAWNMQKVECSQGIDLLDFNSKGEYWEAHEMYSAGITQMFINFVFALLSLTALLFMFVGFIDDVRKK